MSDSKSTDQPAGFNCGCGLRTFVGSRHHQTCPEAERGSVGPAIFQRDPLPAQPVHTEAKG
jgi:hypothetical protein